MVRRCVGEGVSEIKKEKVHIKSNKLFVKDIFGL